MSEKTVTRLRGDLGERVAARYLRRRLYRILERNWFFYRKEIDIIACFFSDLSDNPVSHLRVDETYRVHIVVEFHKDMQNLIFGFVLENNKGLPLFDINNYINQQQCIVGVAGEITEAIYEFKLPRLMKGTYVLSTAIAEGIQEKHEMHTWLHGVGDVEIINPGFNSSYIEVPADIVIEQVEKENVKFIE